MDRTFLSHFYKISCGSLTSDPTRFLLNVTSAAETVQYYPSLKLSINHFSSLELILVNALPVFFVYTFS